jgi:hypothetical protein
VQKGVEQEHQTGPAGVDHPGRFEHIELIRCPREGLGRRILGPVEDFGQLDVALFVGAGAEGRGSGFGRGPDDGEDGATGFMTAW